MLESLSHSGGVTAARIMLTSWCKVPPIVLTSCALCSKLEQPHQ
jgi:hypothetical protein